MNQLVQTLRGLGPMRLAALAGMILAMLVFFGFLTTKMASGPMALLYSNLDPADGGAIIAQLEGQKIPYEVSANGTNIKVPNDKVGRIRMEMAQAGLPRGGSIGYEIFDQKDGFSTTSFVQNINQLRAMEGELARTISTLTPISAARVHLVMPRREMFSQTEQKATASVFVKMRGGATLSKEQVASVRQLIAAAVPNLDTQNVSIVDDHGNLLARMAGNDGSTDVTNHDEMRATFEKAQADKIEELLSRTLGYGKVRAQVSAEMDFDKVSTQSEIYDPESQVVRSTQNVAEEGANSEGSSSNQGVSVSGNLPGTAPAPTASGNSNKNSRSEETVNYEINKTVRNQIRESGNVKKQTVAVLVDGTSVKDKDGKETYTPRTKEELEQIKTLVKSAVNIDATRGDTLEVVNMPFNTATAGEMIGEGAGGIMGFANADILRMVESLLLAVVGLLAILLVVRPILKQVLDGATGAVGGSTGAGGNLLSGSNVGGGGAAKLPPPGGALSAQLAGESEEDESALEKMIDLSRVEGRVKASSVRKVGEIVEKHPEEAVSILRNWIYQEN